MHLKNYMEEVVFNMLERVLNDIHCCTCEKCLMDIAALALNHLPPKYVVTEKGELYTKVNTLQQQCEADVTAAIIKAAEIVKKNPRHK
ncbi:MAG: competence protein ComFB [Petroclostridium sp.]|jgi:competence protein ComFB|uniref:late competence development ComFB family protein n=1 Tax=Petroclostridium xylanilyticum TaxID=1792311 RepID=UPI000B99A75F|nr:late competence development ComFB family protein [Petroclostridium xylanilyticum]MBZ4644725.1 competence protein ComFB [Clostridia bacterium]MDK2811463.1 competence protein ComFB [Petroclostridium sp.]